MIIQNNVIALQNYHKQKIYSTSIFTIIMSKDKKGFQKIKDGLHPLSRKKVTKEV